MQVGIISEWICHVENRDRHDEDEVAETNHQNRPSHLQVASVYLPTVFVAKKNQQKKLLFPRIKESILRLRVVS
jgi:hypothetical protein